MLGKIRIIHTAERMTKCIEFLTSFAANFSQHFESTFINYENPTVSIRASHKPSTRPRSPLVRLIRARIFVSSYRQVASKWRSFVAIEIARDLAKSAGLNDRDVPTRYLVIDPPVISSVAQCTYRN